MDRRIRVLHLIDSLELGGAQTMLFHWFTLADQTRFQLSLAALHANRQTLFLKRALREKLPVRSLSPYRVLPWYLLSLPWLVRRERFDIVHCHLYASNWFGKPLAKLFRVPVVISHDHCYDNFRFENPVVSSLDRWANSYADAILVISERIAQRLVETERIPATKLRVVRNGVPRRTMVVTQPARAIRVIGGAGRLVFWKGFSRLLRLMQHLLWLDPSYRLILAGDGPDLNKLREEADELGIADRVSWPGSVDTLDSFFGLIDLFVLTSELEDLPMVLLEAFAAGVPSAVSGHNLQRRDLENVALVLDHRAPEQKWAAEIHHLFADAPQLERLRENAADYVEQHFSAEKQVRQIEGIYEELLRGKKLRS
jgi:glycosyltransferase involved in cell wall biosynthesis